MTKKKKLFESEKRMNREEAAQFLHQIADKLNDGSVQFKQGGQDVTMELPDEIKFEVEVQSKEKGVKGQRHEIEIELTWYEGDHQSGSGNLEIG